MSALICCYHCASPGTPLPINLNLLLICWLEKQILNLFRKSMSLKEFWVRISQILWHELKCALCINNTNYHFLSVDCVPNFLCSPFHTLYCLILTVSLCKTDILPIMVELEFIISSFRSLYYCSEMWACISLFGSRWHFALSNFF